MDMTPTAGRLLGTLLAVAVALAGCAVARPSAAAPSRTATATAHPAAATALSPKQRAEADAAAILAAFVVPPGARKLPGAPSGQAHQLKDITGSSASPNWIDKTGFWQVEGDPQQVLAWTASHVGRTHTTGGLTTNLPVSGRPETVWELDYGLPPVPAVEDSRELTVEVADAGGGQTAIRVDAQVTWLPAREASQLVPATATAITMSVIPDAGHEAAAAGDPHQPRDGPPHRRAGQLPAGLPARPARVRHAPPGGTLALELTFLAAPHGRVLASAYVSTNECEQVLLAVGPHKLTSETVVWNVGGVTALGVPFGGQAFASTVLKGAGSKWNLAA